MKKFTLFLALIFAFGAAVPNEGYAFFSKLKDKVEDIGKKAKKTVKKGVKKVKKAASSIKRKIVGAGKVVGGLVIGAGGKIIGKVRGGADVDEGDTVQCDAEGYCY